MKDIQVVRIAEEKIGEKLLVELQFEISSGVAIQKKQQRNN